MNYFNGKLYGGNGYIIAAIAFCIHITNIMRILSLLAFMSLFIPIKAANIIFADSKVKALCVANWDTDGDKELSEEEAAAVTSLGNVFRERSDIGAFPELRYFKSLTCIDD